MHAHALVPNRLGYPRLLKPGDKVLVASSTYDHPSAAAAGELFAPYKDIMAQHKARALQAQAHD